MTRAEFLQQHPDLARMIDACAAHLVQCGDPECGAWAPDDEMYHDGRGIVCGACFDKEVQRQRDEKWAEWFDRVAKESRET